MDRNMDSGVRKAALTDSSSAIILFKAGLFNQFAEHYRIIMSGSVFSELTCGNHAGAVDFTAWCKCGKIQITNTKPCNSTGLDQSLQNLGAGERDTILLFYCGSGALVVIDDGKGAVFCRDNDIPYINALLVPRILYIAGRVSEDERERFLNAITGLGRYSQSVIDYARNCDDAVLDPFV